MYPKGIEIKYTPETPKFNVMLVTNQNGNRSYIYNLMIYEKVFLEDQENKNESEKENLNVIKKIFLC